MDREKTESLKNLSRSAISTESYKNAYKYIGRANARMLCRLVTLIFIPVLTGCVAPTFIGPALGPVDSPEFPALVAKALPEGDNETRFYGSGNWYANMRGFRAAIQGPIPPFDATEPIPGILIITTQAVIFQQWDSRAKAYNIIRRTPFTEINSVALDSFGRNRRIILGKQDFSYDSYDFTTTGFVGRIDVEKVESSVEFLLDKISP